MLDSSPFPTEIACGPGLTGQRNAVIASCRDADAVAFFDENFYPAPSYLAQATTERALFQAFALISD
jgi:hypothetical protein